MSKRMKTYTALAVLGSIAMVSSGCATGPETTGTNPKQPGPAVGQAVGAVTGAVVGNVAGAVAGAAEGASAAAKKPFTNERHYVRTWKEEKTADGRTVKVPVDVEVDEYGRPIE